MVWVYHAYKGILKDNIQNRLVNESISFMLSPYLLGCVILHRLPEGLLFGVFLIVLFGLRFLYEYIKENQVDFEDTMSLNMGQILSIPLVIGGIFILLNLKKLQPKKPD